MTFVTLALVIVIGLLLLLMLGAQVEMYENLAQLREYNGLVDRPIPIELGAREGGRPSEFGLPVELDTSLRTLVLILSDKCATCRTLAAELAKSMPPGMLLILEPGTAGRGAQLASTFQFPPNQLIIDRDRAIVDQLGIEISPAAVLVEDGRLARATTVPSMRQLEALLKSMQTIRTGDLLQRPMGES